MDSKLSWYANPAQPPTTLSKPKGTMEKLKPKLMCLVCGVKSRCTGSCKMYTSHRLQHDMHTHGLNMVWGAHLGIMQVHPCCTWTSKQIKAKSHCNQRHASSCCQPTPAISRLEAKGQGGRGVQEGSTPGPSQMIPNDPKLPLGHVPGRGIFDPQPPCT